MTPIAEQAAPIADWTEHVFTLDAPAGWRIHNDTGKATRSATAPTAAQLYAVLGSLSQVLVAADHTEDNTLTGANDIDLTQLHNFQLGALVPEPATAAPAP